MESAQYYESPIGKMLLTADTEGLTGIWFVNQKFYPLHPETTYVDENTEILERAAQWLDSYFSGKNPGSGLPLHLTGTSFQKAVWEILLTIPYGDTMTYGEIAQMLAKQMGYQTMSAQAVGGAARGQYTLTAQTLCGQRRPAMRQQFFNLAIFVRWQACQHMPSDRHMDRAH